MSLEKTDFYGKEVTDAIKKACDELGVPQEKLNIEVVETGSTGIFGLIRKKAHIRAGIKPRSAEEDTPVEHPAEKATLPAEIKEKKDIDVPLAESCVDEVEENDGESDVTAASEDVQISQENLDIVKNELSHLLKLMGYPSEVQTESSGISVHCCIQGGFDDALTGPDGKTLDSLQYILRKIVARRIPDRLRLSINIGDFRERRQQELAEKAVELARMVKEDGKTQMLPALNPSERRVVHMTLQEDKEIRSRSVGEGLFKKVLIYKPGKGKKPGARKHNGSRGAKPKNGKTDTEK
ncbi:MAG: Jag N-terminal domain-containing protein [Desulfocapsaceae bacterium]|nr:Jag N-terminal domain-containing protein [Desulfosporosinus sp.]MDR3629521.1 Jag N-terminal domain-containing protein [Desulfocapsaceae bacterium]